jgi:arsenite methyltransferase
MDKIKIKNIVRSKYGAIASQGGGCGCGPRTSCCDNSTPTKTISKGIGYSDSDLAVIPEDANLGLGCGNPVALASLKKGEVVLDLGSGAGMDCFLAARMVGENGKVIGVDMTAEMLEKARNNNETFEYGNVEFRLGEIENLPVADNAVDAILSNCVINLSPDKDRVFAEAFRVLKPGGRMMISDIVLKKKLPEALAESVSAYVGCVAGALLVDDYIGSIKKAGFIDVKIVNEAHFPIDSLSNDPLLKAVGKESGLSKDVLKDSAGSIVSAKVYAQKPLSQ